MSILKLFNNREEPNPIIQLQELKGSFTDRLIETINSAYKEATNKCEKENKQTPKPSNANP